MPNKLLGDIEQAPGRGLFIGWWIGGTYRLIYRADRMIDGFRFLAYVENGADFYVGDPDGWAELPKEEGS